MSCSAIAYLCHAFFLRMSFFCILAVYYCNVLVHRHQWRVFLLHLLLCTTTVLSQFININGMYIALLLSDRYASSQAFFLYFGPRGYSLPFYSSSLFCYCFSRFFQFLSSAVKFFVSSMCLREVPLWYSDNVDINGHVEDTTRPQPAPLNYMA